MFPLEQPRNDCGIDDAQAGADALQRIDQDGQVGHPLLEQLTQPTRLALQQPLGIARREVLTEQQHARAWEAVVRIERRDGSSGWRSTCMVCTTQLVYYWSPDLIDERGSAVRREGNCLYQYELARPL